jgi:hypothetical protein
MHERRSGFTNGKPLLAEGLSARAQLAAAGALLVLALTLMEPASAFGLTWWQRAVFHAAHVAPAMAMAWWLSGWLFNRPGLQPWPAWLLLALAGAAAGVALAPGSVFLETAFGVVDLDEPGAAPLPMTLTAWQAELPDELLQVPPRTALFWVVMNQWVLWRAGRSLAEAPEPAGVPSLAAEAGATPHGPPQVPPEVRPESRPESRPEFAPATPSEAQPLLDRLPARLGRDLVHLEAQQHYLRVVTTRGEHLLLHGLAPAVAELARCGLAGMQIHRSVWVAWAHVERLDLRPGALAVVLRDGRRLPVGRRRARDVAEAWQRWPGA